MSFVVLDSRPESVLTASLSSSSLVLLSSDLGPDIPSPLVSKGLMLGGKTGAILIHVEVIHNELLLSSGLFHTASTNPPNYPERCVSIFNEEATSVRPGELPRNLQLPRANQSPNPLYSCFLKDGTRASSRGKDLWYREANGAPAML